MLLVSFYSFFPKRYEKRRKVFFVLFFFIILRVNSKCKIVSILEISQRIAQQENQERIPNQIQTDFNWTNIVSVDNNNNKLIYHDTNYLVSCHLKNLNLAAKQMNKIYSPSINVELNFYQVWANICQRVLIQHLENLYTENCIIFNKN